APAKAQPTTPSANSRRHGRPIAIRTAAAIAANAQTSARGSRQGGTVATRSAQGLPSSPWPWKLVTKWRLWSVTATTTPARITAVAPAILTITESYDLQSKNQCSPGPAFGKTPDPQSLRYGQMMNGAKIASTSATAARPATGIPTR